MKRFVLCLQFEGCYHACQCNDEKESFVFHVHGVYGSVLWVINQFKVNCSNHFSILDPPFSTLDPLSVNMLTNIKYFSHKGKNGSFSFKIRILMRRELVINKGGGFIHGHRVSLIIIFVRIFFYLFLPSGMIHHLVYGIDLLRNVVVIGVFPGDHQ